MFRAYHSSTISNLTSAPPVQGNTHSSMSDQQQQAAAAAVDQHELPQISEEVDQQQQQQQADEDAPKQLSKRQQKRLLKMERQQEQKKARKEAEKQEKAKAAEQKQKSIQQMLEGMSEEEQAAWHQKNKEKRQQVAQERAAAKARHQQALSAPQKLVIDLSFSGLMTAGELKSLCQQLSYSYSIAVNGEQQMHLHLLGAEGDIEAAMLKQLPGHVHWSATKSEKGFKDFFQERLQDLVYLTADSPNELAVLEPSKVYILGGLVDRNRHKGICYKRALDAGIATARLPITQHMKLHTSAVITVNQVVDIMSRLLVNPDWRAVLEAVLPGRKRADAAAAAGGGSGSKEPSPAPQGSRPAGTSGTEAAAAAGAAVEAAEAAAGKGGAAAVS